MRGRFAFLPLLLAGCAASDHWEPIAGVRSSSLETAQAICEGEKQKAFLAARQELTVFTPSRLDAVYTGCMAQQGFALRK
jgi:hypothetical protein